MSEAAVNVNNNISIAFPPSDYYATESGGVTAVDVVANERARDEFHDRSITVIADYIHDQIDASGDPEAVNAQRHAMINDMADEAMVNGAGGQFGDDIEAFMEKSMEWLRREISESNDDTEGGERTGGGGKSWLVAIMKALSENAGRHLARTIELADEIGNMESSTQDITDGMSDDEKTKVQENNTNARAEEARQMTQLQGEMQAEMQLFKMSFEAAASLGKTAGQGFQSMARAQ